ncbi:MAG TPA: DnaJ domain-containing protein [bacterium]|nr:DnaJ domain-containing protein [bacterium]
MSERNHYEVLGAAKSSTPDEIHACYLERLHQVHPDRNAGDDEAAHEKTIEAVAAYRVLSDPAARRRYDFRCGNPFRFDGELPGLKLLKGRKSGEAESHFTDSVRFIRADDLVKAVDPLKAALKLEPDYPAASYNLALAGALLGNGNFALGVLTAALKRDPKDASLQRLHKAVVTTFLTV